MISYKPFYDTLSKRNITEYALIFKHGIPANTLHRMKHGEAITTKTLDELCFILDCEVEDILLHIKKDKDETPAWLKAGYIFYVNLFNINSHLCLSLYQQR